MGARLRARRLAGEAGLRRGLVVGALEVRGRGRPAGARLRRLSDQLDDTPSDAPYSRARAIVRWPWSRRAREAAVAAGERVEQRAGKRSSSDVSDAVVHAEPGAGDGALAAVVEERGLQHVGVGAAAGDEPFVDVEAVALVGGLHRGEERVEAVAEDAAGVVALRRGDAWARAAPELADAVDGAVKQRHSAIDAGEEATSTRMTGCMTSNRSPKRRR